MPGVDQQPVMHRLRPFTGYVTVIESEVDEEQRTSGLIVPLGGSDLRRGVVLHTPDVAYEDVPMFEAAAQLLTEGTVVYFRQGERIADVIVVAIHDVVAYMEDE